MEVPENTRREYLTDPESLNLEQENLLAKIYIPKTENRLTKKGKKNRTRLTDDGRDLINNWWSEIVNTVGETATSAEIRQKIEQNNVLGHIKKITSEQQGEEDKTKKDKSFARLAALSIEKRLEARQRAEFIAEISASNSPWKEVFEDFEDVDEKNRSNPWRDALRQIRRKIYQNEDVLRKSGARPLERSFIENFVAQSLFSLKKRIDIEIDAIAEQRQLDNNGKAILGIGIEIELADVICRYLEIPSDDLSSEDKEEKLQELAAIRESGLGTLAETAINWVQDKESTTLHEFIDSRAGQIISLPEATPQITADNIPEPPPDPSRRRFLKLAGGAVIYAIAGPTIKTIRSSFPELEAGVGAALARPEMPNSGQEYEASQSVLLAVWRKHFQGKEHLLPEKVWVRSKETLQGEKLEGTGVYLSMLARNFYESEKKDGENFDAYYAHFVDSLHDLSDLADLDFITLTTSLQISAENAVGFSEPKKVSNIDVNVSRVQEVVITAARSLGLELPLIELLGPNGLAIEAKNKLREAGVNIPSGIDDALPEKGIRHYDLIRFREQPTTGMMDMEPGERSEAFRMLENNSLVQKLEQDYPEVASEYRVANKGRDAVQEPRKEMRRLANIYIEEYSDNLKPFANGDVEALDAIGISSEMDQWQLQNYTDVWYKVSEIPTNPEFAYQRTVEYMKEEAVKDPQSFYRKFFSQQIRNGKFIEYLLNQAKENGNQEELSLLSNIRESVKVYEEKAKQLRVAHLDVLKAEGPYEYDSKFQQIASILVTKRLSEMAGDFRTDDRDNLGWHIYKVCAMREIAPIPFLIDEEHYARDITIDPPYAQEAVALSLDTFAKMLLEAGILEVAPDDDIKTAYGTLEKMFWRDGGVWPSVPKDKWEQILDHFNTKLANRLFYDFAGLLHDESKMSELNQRMMDKGILSQPAKEAPYYFFTQFVYLLLDSWHMRRDIPKEDWDEVEKYFQANILPIAVTKIETSPGVFKEEYHIGSADYPPIFRSQAVMYNFLFDKNPVTPQSFSSSEQLGLH